jgi:hypothetical protein
MHFRGSIISSHTGAVLIWLACRWLELPAGHLRVFLDARWSTTRCPRQRYRAINAHCGTRQELLRKHFGHLDSHWDFFYTSSHWDLVCGRRRLAGLGRKDHSVASVTQRVTAASKHRLYMPPTKSSVLVPQDTRALYNLRLREDQLIIRFRPDTGISCHWIT